MEFCNSVAENTTLMPIGEGGKSLTICVFIKIQYHNVTDRWTEVVEHLTLQYTLCMLPLHKKYNHKYILLL